MFSCRMNTPTINERMFFVVLNYVWFKLYVEKFRSLRAPCSQTDAFVLLLNITRRTL